MLIIFFFHRAEEESRYLNLHIGNVTLFL